MSFSISMMCIDGISYGKNTITTWCGITLFQQSKRWVIFHEKSSQRITTGNNGGKFLFEAEGSMIPTKCQGGCPQLAAVFPKKCWNKLTTEIEIVLRLFGKKKDVFGLNVLTILTSKKRDRRSNAPAGLTVSLKKNVNPHYTPIYHHYTSLIIVNHRW